MSILEELQNSLPAVSFMEDTVFCWSPKTASIHFPAQALAEEEGTWALLHEAGHATLAHQTYATDFELVSMEVAAWEKAKELAKTLGITISNDHIQDCLDTYRDWLHKRSTCPTCGSVSLQQSESLYTCHNCPAQWTVTRARLCRPYRALRKGADQSISHTKSAIFH
jgi:NADH dehydrogenase/NADH:ubiquinone oxidoreductase subunit G